jgi:hypothetical protein
MAVWAWTVIPLLALHLWWWRRSRWLLRFQLTLDVVLAVVIGPALLFGVDLNPVRSLENNHPFRNVGWSDITASQPAQSDLVLQFHPWFSETRRHLSRGELPWISDRIGGGMPLYANGQIGLLAPVNIPLWCLGPERGTTVMALWKLELAGLGAFLLLWRGWRLRWSAAAVGGVAFAGGAYQLGWLLVPLSWTTAAVPWLWWLATVVARRRARPVLIVGLGVVSGWLIGCGLHPETALIAVGSALLTGLVLHPCRWSRMVVVVAVAVLIAAALAWPTLGAIRVSEKAVWLKAERPNRDRPPVTIRIDAVEQLVVPMANGHPGRGDWQGRYPYPAAAVGIGGLALALIGVGRVRGRFRRHRWAAWACLGLGAVLLYRLPPLDSLLVAVPPISSMTLPRFGMLVAWGLAVWAALAVDGALWDRVRGPACRLATAAVVAAVALSGMPWRLVPVDFGLVLLTIVGAVVSGWLLRRPAALAPAVAVELALYAVGINPTAAPQDRLPRPDLVERLAELQARDGGRFIGVAGVLPANLGARYGLSDLRAYDPLRPHPYARLMASLGDPRPVIGGPLASAPARLCGAWSVRYLATRPDAQPPGWQLEWQGSSGAVWRNPHWLPEVRTAIRAVQGDGARGWHVLTSEKLDFATVAVVPTGSPEVRAARAVLEEIEASSTAVRVRVRCDGPCLLVVARPWTPGWQATVDGVPAPVVRANLAGLGVAVPSGTHRAELRYRPWTWHADIR